jgi:signal peptidase
MTDTPEKGRFSGYIHAFRKSDNPMISLLRDILWVVVVVGGIALFLFLVSGTWPAVVAVESESMIPNMQVGDLVFVVQKDRFGNLTTWEEGEETGYARFATHPDIHGEMPYGDVIIYHPNGAEGVHPIIHRVIRWVEGSSHPGYITKGDNNKVADQETIYPGIGRIEPVKEEWIVGKAWFAIPLVGYLPLHIVEFAVIILILMVVHELYLRSRSSGSEPSRKGKRG